MILGAQLYTVRDFCKDLDGISDSLKKIAEIGYTTVHLSGTCEYDPKWIKQQFDKNGLRCVANHPDRELMATDPKGVAKAHKTLDCKNIGVGWFPLEKEGVAAFYDKYIKTAELFNKKDLRLCYHNHDNEFAHNESGVTFLQELADKFPPDLLHFILDTYWVQAGGGDPAAWIESLSGRGECVHFKDMGYERKMLPIGVGNLNWSRILKACETAGTEFLLVEQDNCNGEDPFECLKVSYEYLKSFGLK